jgi:four helix bundle protein
MFRFEKLDVWQRAVQFAETVYAATASFPTDERFGLTNQLRRAAISVTSNIAEGSGRVFDADFARFLEIAYGSLMEVISQSTIAKQQSFLPQEKYDALYNDSQELARMLSGLRSSLLKQQRRSPSRDRRRTASGS